MMANPKFILGDLPETNWLRKYYEFHTEFNKAPYPELFHASGLAILQMHIGRRVYFTLAGRNHYLNLQLLCLAPTTTNKSDAIYPATQWLYNEFPEQALATDFSGAGFSQGLAECPNGWIVNDEAGTLLSRIHYSKEASSIRDTLCRIYDNATEIKIRLSKYGKGKENNGEMKITKPWLSLLLATTPETFSQYSVGLDLYSGWLPRFLMYNPNYSKPPTKLVFGKKRDDGKSELTLMKELRLIEQMLKKLGEVEVLIEGDTEKFVQMWKLRNEEQFKEHRIHRTIFIRLMIMAIKLAAIYQLCDEDAGIIGHQMPLKRLYIEIAARQVDAYFMTHAVSVFEMLERDASKNIQDKIISKLNACGGKIELWRISKDLHISAKLRDEHLLALQQSREVVVARSDGLQWVRWFKESDLEKLGGDEKNLLSTAVREIVE
jgi:hypothetical protein